jgi:hypothetical protein
VEAYREQLEVGESADRRHGYYRGHLLTELGDTELNVPWTRRYSPVEVIPRLCPTQAGDRPGDSRRPCARLPQDVELFSGTIAENTCRFGLRKGHCEVKTASVHDMIQMMPAGYKSVTVVMPSLEVSDSGLAYHEHCTKPAFIVLDGPNANLDADGEAALLSAVQQLRQPGSTSVLITHETYILA